jgi:hypothetical protein
MDGRFPANGTVWLAGAPLAANTDLCTLTRDDLVHVYNNEMRRRRAAGDATALDLTERMQKKPKAVIELKVGELRAVGAPLMLPPTLVATSMPGLNDGTRLVTRKSDGDREYAVVTRTNESGKVNLRCYGRTQLSYEIAENTTITRYQRDPAPVHGSEWYLATFLPSPRPANPDMLAHSDYWRLYAVKLDNSVSGWNYVRIWWALAPAEDAGSGAGAAVEWSVTRARTHE